MTEKKKQRTIVPTFGEIQYVTKEIFSWSRAIHELDKDVTPQFNNEREYTEWFISEPLKFFIPHVSNGAELADVQTEKRLGRLRIDVLATATNGDVFGFELKAQNKRSPQVHAYSVASGIGQALLYQDILCEMYKCNVTVFLTSDQLTSRVAGIVARRDYFIGLLQANKAGSICFMRATEDDDAQDR